MVNLKQAGACRNVFSDNTIKTALENKRFEFLRSLITNKQED